MSKVTLTEARVRALRPRKTVYDIRDGKLTGFGVRVLPSGRKRFFVHCQHQGERKSGRSLATPATMDVREARLSAIEMLAALRRGETCTLRTGRSTLRGRRRDRVPSVTSGSGSREPSM